MREPHERLEWAREQAGFDNPREAARNFSWNENTYKSHENGLRGFRYDSARRYGRAFKVSPAWLMTGEGAPDKITVPVVAYVGAGAEIYSIDDHEKGAGIDEVEAPPGVTSGVVAVRVLGDSMYPVYRDGDKLFYDRQSGDVAECVGRECVVKLQDGRAFVKIVQRSGANGAVNLISHNAPPIENVEPEWIAPIVWIKRA